MQQIESTPAISMVPVVSSSNVTAFGYDPAMSGETFMLSARPIWVRPIAIAISVQGA